MATNEYIAYAIRAARFWSKVSVGRDSECWTWSGFIDEHGYGKCYFQGRCYGSHRVAYILAHGEKPEVVRHSCDNPPCCNPYHLKDGTHADNVLDRVTRGRSAKGIKNGRAKLSPEQAREIYLSEDPDCVICEQYGVNQGVVSGIKRRRIWKDATENLASVDYALLKSNVQIEKGRVIQSVRGKKWLILDNPTDYGMVKVVPIIGESFGIPKTKPVQELISNSHRDITEITHIDLRWPWAKPVSTKDTPIDIIVTDSERAASNFAKIRSAYEAKLARKIK
jgi:hypothetical protein